MLCSLERVLLSRTDRGSQPSVGGNLQANKGLARSRVSVWLVLGSGSLAFPKHCVEAPRQIDMPETREKVK